MPHRLDAVLLEEITAADEHRLAARLVVRPGTAFSDAAGNLPGHVGPEILAQAIATLSGYRALRARSGSPEIGLLLGVRSYRTTASEFQPGDELDVEVIESSEDEEGRAVFNGTISRAAQVVASGTLTVFQPRDGGFLDQECARDV
jgi:predicted hotdog family 3-hydroxylacyl-ACP dehydratase